MKVVFLTRSFFPPDEEEKGTSIEQRSTQTFADAEEAAMTLILEGMERQFSDPEFSPDGYWSSPLNTSPISGLQEFTQAFPHEETSEAEWREVFNQLQTVKSA